MAEYDFPTGSFEASRKERTPSRFRMRDWLIAAFVIAGFIALGMLLVQDVHVPARRAHCISNLREIGQAILTYENAHQRFPGYDNQLVLENVGLRRASWLAEILPQLGEQPLADLWGDPNISTVDLERPFLRLLVCPEREPNTSIPDNSYVVNSGFWVGDYPRGSQWKFPAPWDDPTTFAAPETFSWWQAMRAANGLFVDRWTNPTNRVSMIDIIDGATNTLMISENLQAGRWDWTTDRPDLRDPNVPFAMQPVDQGARMAISFVWLYTLDNADEPRDLDRPAPTFYLDAHRQYSEARINGLTKIVPADRPSLCRPSSNHDGVVVVAFADRRVMALNENIDYHVYQQLCTPNGRQSDSPGTAYILRAQDYDK